MGTGWKANTEGGFHRFLGAQDFNLAMNICDASRFKRPGVKHEGGQDAVCASHGVRSVEDLRTDLCADHHYQKGASPRCLALHIATDIVSLGFREIPTFMRSAADTGTRLA